MAISFALNIFGFFIYFFMNDWYQGFEMPAIGGGTHYIKLDQDSLDTM
jgi:hypothetical protein